MPNALLIRHERQEWEAIGRDLEWDRWFELVCYEMKVLFGEDACTDEQEKVAERALALKGICPPSRPCPY
jgi:hypothetical protein